MSEEVNMIEEAKKVRDEMKVLLEEQKAVLQQMQEMKVKEILSGRAEAGVQIPVKEETPLEYRKRVLGY